MVLQIINNSVLEEVTLFKDTINKDLHRSYFFTPFGRKEKA